MNIDKSLILDPSKYWTEENVQSKRSALESGEEKKSTTLNCDKDQQGPESEEKWSKELILLGN